MALSTSNYRSLPGVLLHVLFGLLSCHSILAGDDPESFRSIFDGRSFAGWRAPDMQWWSIEEGAITGRITPDKPCGTNQYLVWQGGDLTDFELKLKSRLNGTGAINNGFQFRSRVLPDGDVAGYQVDNNLQTDWLVRLYDEFGRHTLAWRGKQTLFDSTGKATTIDLPEGAGAPWFRLEDWHEYHLTCSGPRLTLRIDGRLAAQVEDHDSRRADLQGALALQLHSGPPTVVQFKDIQLKLVRPVATRDRRPRERRRDSLLASALAYWDFAVGGHQLIHPLRYVGSLDDVEFNVRAVGSSARPGARVAQLRGGRFETSIDIPLADPAVTVFLRVADPSGQWRGTLLSRRDRSGSMSLRLFGEDQVLGFEVRTAQGRADVRFPLSQSHRSGWFDLVGRYDGRTLELLANGRSLAHRGWEGGPIAPGPETWILGADRIDGKTTEAFHGELEEAAIWGRTLSDREIDALTRTGARAR